MKKLILLLSFLLTIIFAFSNVAPMSSAYISELYFDENGDWTIELYFKYYDSEIDTGYVMITSTDTAFFKKFPDSTNIILLTNDDLSNPIFLDKAGEMVRIENWSLDIGGDLSGPLIFGDYPGSTVNAPYSGQSMVRASGHVVKDTASSLGFLRDPPKGILQGHIYDSVGNPLPYIRVQTYGIEAKILWPDENGFFTDTLYAKNYSIFIYNNNPTKIYSGGFTIEPDSVTIHDISLPVSSEIQISGYSFLVGSEDHHNTKIYLTPQCPFAPTDTILTDSTGYYSKTISIGHYYLRYSHENYLPYYTYTFVDMFYDYQMYDTYLEEGIIHEITDSLVSGTWVADHPYWIFTNLYIAENDTLSIDPGVQIIFKRKYHLNVYGTLLAEGTSTDSIFFTKSPGNWGSLNFQSETSSGSSLEYTDISFQESINFYNSDASIRKSRISWNGDLCFYDSASPIITECFFDYGISLVCNNESSPIISKNIIRNTANFGIYCLDESTPKIYNNDFFDSWVGVYFDDQSKPNVNGNIFYDLGFGIFEHRIESDYYHIRNNLFFDCGDPVWWYFGHLYGFGDLDTVNFNGDSCDIYFNLFMDPMLTDPGNGDFTLMPGSPCIDAGNPEFEHDPDSTIADIGALYFDQSGVLIHDRKPLSPSVKMYHYPNPSTGNINFVIEGNGMRKISEASIKIFNLSGKLVGELECPFIEKGFGKKIYSYSNNALNSGTYLYTLENSGQIISSNKLIVVK